MPTSWLYGVDFSGAAQAGSKIWLTAGHIAAGRLVVDWCCRAADLPGGGLARGPALVALRTLIAQAGDALFGLDVPPSLPAALMQAEDWRQFARTFATRYPTPEAFRADCYARAAGRELRRRTDIASGTPFAAYNLRLYRQTYYAIRDVFAPLVTNQQARLLPIQDAIAGLPTLIEICPAATLKHARLYTSYKGRTASLRAAREHILTALLELFPLQLPGALTATLLDDPEGDALDSLLALCATFRMVNTPFTTPPDALDRLEGRVYL